MLRVFDTAYQVSYSESYTGNVHGNSAIEGYHYCMSFLGAFESLMAQSYTSFILGVRCIVVGICCCNNGALKYLILMVEICMETVTLKGHAFF